MIQEFVDKFIAKQKELFKKNHPSDYIEIVREVIRTINPDNDDYNLPNFERIHEIDDGDYQGTLLYIIAACGYQPSDYWYVYVDYGSCSGCDALEGIREYCSEPPSEQQSIDYQALALHIAQGISKLNNMPIKDE